MPDLAFEALCAVCSIDWQDGNITANQRGRINAALRQLREVYQDDPTLPTMIEARAEAWAVVYPETPPTPQALSSTSSSSTA